MGSTFHYRNESINTTCGLNNMRNSNLHNFFPGLETPYLNHNAIDPIILRDARAFCGVSGNQKGVATAGRESRVLIRTPAHIQSGKITMFNQLCLHGMRFKPGDSGTCVYVYTPGNFNRPTGCIGMLIGESTCNHSILTPMTEILKVFDL